MSQWRRSLPLSISRYVLGAFATLRKATVSFVMSVRPSVWKNSATTGWILMKFHIWFFRKSVEKIQVSLKSDNNNGYFTWRRFHIYDNISLNSSYKEMFETKVVEKIKTHILCPVTFFFENRAVYEVISKNVVEPERPQRTIWLVRVAFWISKDTRAQTHVRACAPTTKHMHADALIHAHAHKNI